jgi:hypothetical protein
MSAEMIAAIATAVVTLFTGVAGWAYKLGHQRASSHTMPSGASIAAERHYAEIIMRLEHIADGLTTVSRGQGETRAQLAIQAQLGEVVTSIEEALHMQGRQMTSLAREIRTRLGADSELAATVDVVARLTAEMHARIHALVERMSDPGRL